MKAFQANRVVLAIAFAAPASGVLAWGTLSHIIIAVQFGGGQAGPGFHNAPDFWPSKHIGWQNSGVTNEFCWSHECQRWAPLGGLRQAIVPSYYPESQQRLDCSPPEHMRIFLEEKLLPVHTTPLMSELWRGWSKHNGEDLALHDGLRAHFNLFPGPVALTELDKWLYHRDYELYADVLLYVYRVYAGDPDAAFQGSWPWSEPTGLPAGYLQYLSSQGTGDASTDGLICLTMKAFRKKQQTVDREVLEGLAVQSASDISTSRQQEIALPLGSGLLSFTRQHWNSARAWLDTPAGQGFWHYFGAATVAAGQ